MCNTHESLMLVHLWCGATEAVRKLAASTVWVVRSSTCEDLLLPGGQKTVSRTLHGEQVDALAAHFQVRYERDEVVRHRDRFAQASLVARQAASLELATAPFVSLLWSVALGAGDVVALVATAGVKAVHEVAAARIPLGKTLVHVLAATAVGAEYVTLGAGAAIRAGLIDTMADAQTVIISRKIARRLAHVIHH